MCVTATVNISFVMDAIIDFSCVYIEQNIYKFNEVSLNILKYPVISMKNIFRTEAYDKLTDYIENNWTQLSSGGCVEAFQEYSDQVITHPHILNAIFQDGSQ